MQLSASSNIWATQGNARLYGLEDDLNLTGQQFPIALSLFFVTYVLVEIPSNLVIKRVGASRWIPVSKPNPLYLYFN